MKFQDVLFSPNGRINRQPYWIATVVLVGVGLVAGMIPIVGLIISLGSIYCSVCIYNKRLHDIGKSGWWQLIAWIASIVALGAMVAAFLPVLGSLMSGVQDDQAILAAMIGASGAFLVAGLCWLVCLAFHIWLGVVTGQPGSNAYGPNPLNPVEVETFA